MSPGRMVAFLLTFVAGGMLAAAMSGTALAGSTVELQAPGHAKLGRPFEVVVFVDGRAGVAGFEAELHFDTSAAEFASASERPSRLNRLAGSLGQLGPVELPNGVVLGSYTCPAADCGPHGRAGPGTGAKGRVVLARVRLTPLEPGRLELRLDRSELVGPDGARLAISGESTRTTVRIGSGRHLYSAPTVRPSTQRASQTWTRIHDVSGDTRVDEQDVTEMALQWIVARNDGSICGTTNATTGFDANHDGCLDVSDVQAYAGEVATRSATNIVAAAANPALVVNAFGDGTDVSPGNGVCRTAASTCTLRAAIQEANAQPGANDIVFAIPGNGVQTIQLGSQLPTLSDTSGPTTINGYTQPGASANTAQFASNAQIMIQLRGTGSSTFDALVISSPGNVITGLAFFNFRRSVWLHGSAAKNNWIKGDFIGTNAAGTFGFDASAFNLSAIGIEFDASANNNHIGEATLAGRNVISGNARHGLACYRGTSNVLYNNIVGLSPGGDRRLPNVYHGSDWNSECSNNVIGGTGPLERNIFSGNGVPGDGRVGEAGIEVSHGPDNFSQKIIGNCFGTDVSCTTATSWTFNNYWGINIEDNASNVLVDRNVVVGSRGGGIRIGLAFTSTLTNNLVGVSRDGQSLPNSPYGILVLNRSANNRIGPGNTIAHNPVGVRVQDSGTDKNTVTRNSIFANGGLGIDLDPNGVNPNDVGDGDSGANQQLNFPVLGTATSTSVRGTACAGCVVEVFVADADPSGYGEGRTFLGSSVANSTGGFSVTISGVGVGQMVTATATDGQGNTSEFAKRLSVS